jgi:hypothetical protein
MSTKIPQFTIPPWLVPHVAEVRAWAAIRGPHPRCIVAACDRTAFSLGVCRDHYDNLRGRARRAGQSLAVWVAEHPDEVRDAPALLAEVSLCWVAACDHSAVSNGLCHSHSMTARRRFKPRRGEEQCQLSASDRETPTTTPEEANR